MQYDSRELDRRLERLKVLVVDDEPFMRKVVRTLLTGMGVRNIVEAHDGMHGLDAIRREQPDVVILDWSMPGLDGPAFVRMVRSPETFPTPDIPIIMLTGHGERTKVIEAVEIGVNEFLLKPVSTKSLRDRMAAVLLNPRPNIRSGHYYGPAPRKLVDIHRDEDERKSLIYLN
ncbi:MAG TPA: response regulator [Pseudolabrys sp.]|nr:response regulator [Pseudolabrys sp.]